MKDLRLVTYCGLYCGLCAQCSRIPQRARALRQAMHLESYEFWAKDIPRFENFWVFLNDLAKSESQCSCRSGQCGPPFCEIRNCARSRNLEVCVFCSDYPCDRIQALAARYPTLLADGQRLKNIGIEAWITEQEQRRRAGFCYADIRCQTENGSEQRAKADPEEMR